MKIFLTSGSNLFGRRLIEKLCQRGDEVYALATSAVEVSIIETAGGIAVLGELNDVDSMRSAMAGSDLLFHNRDLYDPYGADWRQMELINVSGTRDLMRLAKALAIPKIVYTSHAAIYGDTAGVAVDEGYRPDLQPIAHYHRTKWLAHFEVIGPLIASGMPIITVTPAYTFGADSDRYLDHLMGRFYQNRFPFPILFGPNTMLSIVHVDDVIDGHLLAAEKGEIGENYHLAGPAVTLRELVDFWSRITGRRELIYQVPSRYVHSMNPIFGASGEVVKLSPMILPEMTALLGTTSILSAAKAKETLGWHPRSIQGAMLETFEKIAHKTHLTTHRRAGVSRNSIAPVLVAAAVVGLVTWLIWGRGQGES